MTARPRALILGSVVAAAILSAAPIVSAQTISVTGASPSSAAQGATNVTVTISGKNFKAGAVVAFYKTGTTDTGGVVVAQTVYKRSAQLIATVNVPNNADVGNYDIKVTAGSSQGTGVALFRVTAKAIDPCTSGQPLPTTGDIFGSPGLRDGTFGSNGVVIGPRFMEAAAFAVQHVSGEERIVVVGRSRDKCAGGNWEWTIVRYRPGGELDTEFGTNGMVTKTFADGEVSLKAVAIDNSERIVVGGTRHMSSYTGFVARCKVDGQLDTTFAPDGVEPGIRSLSLERYMTEAHAIAIQPDGKILIAGTDGGAMAIFRLTDAGNFDVNGFNANAVKPQRKGRYVDLEAPGLGYGVALQGDGILVAGRRGVMREDQTGDQDGAIWRFTIGGLPDSTFGTSGMVTTGFAHADDYFSAMALDGSDKIVVTGIKYDGPSWSDPFFAILARYKPDGTPDSDFHGGVPVVLRQEGWSTTSSSALAITSQGDILVGGAAGKRDAGGYTTYSGAALWRFNSSGELDVTFGSDGWTVDTLLDDGIYAGWKGLVLQEDGKVIAAGSSTWGAAYPVLIRFWQ